MKQEQSNLIKPFAAHIEQMYALIVEMKDDELQPLLDACLATSQTNCGWSTFHAARKFVEPEVRGEIARRARAHGTAKE